MRNVKVTHLSSVHTTFDIRIFLKECKSLANAGFEVNYVVADQQHNGLHSGVNIISISKANGRLERMTKVVKKVYEVALELNSDVYHFHDPELIPVGLLLKSKGKKVIYDAHEDVPRDILSKTWIPKYVRSIIANTFEVLEDFAARRFDTIVTATPYIQERFLRIGAKSVNINNYPFLEEFNLPTVNWAEKENIVCYVGGINEIRGVHEMVRAIGQTNAQLAIGGLFSSEADYQKAIHLDGWSQVKELGQLHRNEVSDLFNKSRAGLVIFHPEENHINAQPNKMFEYMSAGLPVIASNFPLWREIIEGNQCGICVDPLNPREIADAINWIMEHPEKSKEMGLKGRRAIENRYNWETEQKNLVQLYKELV
ncbi:glycosyltransferase family 4 protein [Brevibacillus sp. SYSU BS000544]|uniref:glycosyltransferase family 4 protein n=1 Tax=Brevibacillus sp. SYSU BS000544 TaxID=3416443 RepID=UPI003CE59B3C